MGKIKYVNMHSSDPSLRKKKKGVGKRNGESVGQSYGVSAIQTGDLETGSGSFWIVHTWQAVEGERLHEEN